MARIGVQLYTVMDELKKDYLGTVKRVTELGYEGVEFPSGLIDTVKKEDLRAVLNECGAGTIGAVFSLDEIESRAEKIFDYLRYISAGYVIYFGFMEPQTSEEAVMQDAVRLNKIGEMVNQAGFKFLYHVHGHEFNQIEGKYAFDILFAHLDTKKVQLEIDVYWVEWADVDSLGFMQKYGAFSPCVHLKDMADKVTKADIEVGGGALDMAGIIDTGKKYGADWFIVEQEAFAIPTMRSIAVSLKNINKLIAE